MQSFLRHLSVLSLLLIFGFACQGVTTSTAGSKSGPERNGLDRQVRVFVTETGSEITLGEMIVRLASHEAVFLGETHLDEVTHSVEEKVYEGLLGLTNDQVVLALEMFERDVQPVVDDYIQGRIDETAFLAAARPWGNYRTGYRGMIELARARRSPVVAANTPISVRRAMAFGGAEAFHTLPAEQRAFLPPELLPNTDRYWERFARVVRGHGHAGMAQDTEAMLYSTQSLWDNTMGWSCAEALEAHPEHVVLHVNGGFHTAWRDGTVLQLLTRRPQTDVATVQISSVSDLSGLEADDLDPGYADFHVFTERRGRGLQDGDYAVHVPREAEYRLHLPAAAHPGTRVPLLIWLPSDGLTAADGLALWREEIGSDAAIAVLDSPFPQIEENLRRGGRWYWDETFARDVGAMSFVIDRIARTIPRDYPVDAERIVVAGEGTGATVVALTSWYSDDIARTIAAAPSRFTKLAEQGLPDPPQEIDGVQRTILVTESDRAFWEGEVEAWRSVGRPSQLEIVDSTESALERLRNQVRTALGLASTAPAGGGTPLQLTLPVDTTLGRQWARREAWRLHRDGRPVSFAPRDPETESESSERRVLALRGEAGVPDEAAAFGPETFAEGRHLPLAPGAFGGTTVVVIPAGASAADREAWSLLAEEDVLKKRSRFHSLRVAFESDGPSLPEVLAALREGGRRNVLIVPAAFCASAETMRSLRAAVGTDIDEMTLAWSPGLGADL